MYRVTVTWRVCPIRCTRSIACDSAMGFQCGSRKCMWLATVKSTLDLWSSCQAPCNVDVKIGVSYQPYPSPALPIVASIIVHSGSSLKAVSAFVRSWRLIWPSIRRNWKLGCSARSTRSSILVQFVKITLHYVLDSKPPGYGGFCIPFYCFLWQLSWLGLLFCIKVTHQGLQFGGLWNGRANNARHWPWYRRRLFQHRTLRTEGIKCVSIFAKRGTTFTYCVRTICVHYAWCKIVRIFNVRVADITSLLWGVQHIPVNSARVFGLPCV